MTEVSIDLKVSSPLHKKTLEALNARFRLSAQRMSRLHEKWRKSEEQFIAFLPEREADAKRRVLREQGGKPQYTTIVLPYTYAMLMSAHSYWTTVFLSRTPVNQFTGRHGESSQQVQALEALIDYQVQVGRHLIPYYFWLLDAGKYGLGILANYWEENITTISKYEEIDEIDPIFNMPTGRKIKQMSSQDVRGYYGNKVVNVRPYDYYPDPRVPLWEVQRGEFVGYLSELGLLDLIRGQNQGRYINVDVLKAKRQNKAGKGNDTGLTGNDGGLNTGREQGSQQIELPNDQSFQLNYSDLIDTGPYGIVTLYVDLIASEWGLGKSDTPEKWVFTCSNTGGATVQGANQTLEYILEARPLGCWHNKFPISVIEMEPEAYAFASRGMPEIMKPMQDTMDWLLNSHMYNVRKVLNDMFLIDPSRIVMKDFLEGGAGGGIRLKPAAYGTDPKTAMTQLPVMDVTSAHLSDINFMHEFAQRAVGVNDQIMGLEGGAGRKTAQEVRTSSTFGVNRQKTISELFSAMGFGPHAEMLVQNSQQYFDQGMKLKIVGDLGIEAGQKFIDVVPDDIQGFFDFVPVDGTMPIDRFAQANLWKELLAGMQQMPQIAAQYDIGRIFAWVAQLAGLKNIGQFRVQIAPDAQLQAAAQAGNVIPMAGKTPDGLRNPPVGRQIPGLGTPG